MRIDHEGTYGYIKYDPETGIFNMEIDGYGVDLPHPRELPNPALEDVRVGIMEVFFALQEVLKEMNVQTWWVRENTDENT